jgi:hypothetical protein
MRAEEARDTEGFGCPRSVDPHHFRVEIPAGRGGIVLIAEHYGIKAGICGAPEFAERCYLPRRVWGQIADDVKRDFNERLRAKKMKPGRWLAGSNKVERLLGKELLVLAWAVEKASAKLVGNAVRNWIGLRPEERWWLYTVTAAATGRAEQADLGWRKALRFALTENPADDAALSVFKAPRLVFEEPSPFEAPLPLFDYRKVSNAG